MPVKDGNRAKPASLDSVKHFAKVSRGVVLRGMAPDQCLSTRIFWALVLWSWCGPEKTEDGTVVRKDARGYIERDKKGQPIPAQQKDLIALLGLKPGLKGEVCRRIARFIEGGRVYTDDAGTLYIDPEPPAFESLDSVANTRNWKIADRTIRSEDLPSDPVASTAAIQRLEELSTAWKNDLKALRTRYRLLLVQADFGGPILIDKKRREVKEENPSSSSAFSTVVEEPAADQKAEEEDGYETFKKLYPQNHFDEGKARPAFQALKAAGRQKCIQQLMLYLGCDRWKADGGRWIPLASNWLKAYDADPPPLIATAAGKSNGDTEYWERKAQELNELRAKGELSPVADFWKWKASLKGGGGGHG